MSETATASPAREQQLLVEARGGDEGAFQGLIEPHRALLHAHCYRMLGSVHDAEDALQDAMLRAWKGIGRFEARSSVRSWLYKICTNVCLDEIARRPKRVLPVDYGPAADPDGGPGEPIVESIWIEPYPDETLGQDDGLAGPEASYEQRESVELAFIAALQHLPATQRAVLILREVLGFSARETAETLETTTASVNSALQRARASLHKKLPDQSQQAALRAIGDEELRELVDAYVDAWERRDVEAVVAMLSEDATFAMPPLATWFGGRAEIGTFLRGSPLSGDWQWRVALTSANAQPGLAFYAWDDEAGAHMPFALNVLSFRDGLISDVTAFITRAAPGPDREVVARMPEHPVDPEAMAAAFGQFDLPERIA
jgi:RNA polymerase sigma-70 factor (ECF subfamily)